MVTAALRSVFAKETSAQIAVRWDDPTAILAERFPKAAGLMHEAKEHVLAFRHFPKDHWRKIWSIRLLELQSAGAARAWATGWSPHVLRREHHRHSEMENLPALHKASA